MRRLFAILALLIIVGSAAGGAWYWRSSVAPSAAAYKTPQERADVYTRFVMEVYDLIQQNYWQKATDAQLAQFFQLSLQKASNTTTLSATDRASTAKMLGAAFDKLGTSDDKKKLALSIVQIALYNLAPAGRSELLSSDAQKAVQQTVDNINPSSDLYGELGVAPSSTAQEIRRAYAQTKSQLQASSSPQAAKELVRAGYARDVLSNPADKARYDSTKAEPTVFAHRIGGTLYVDVAKMSPPTIDEFTAALEAASSSNSSSMIIDLRGNIGGDLGQITDFVGLFMGFNQYAFDIFHQGDFTVMRSAKAKLPELSGYREIAVLTDPMTQSSAEVFTAALKRFHLATVVGGKTRGWGTIEGTYPLKTSIDPGTAYALMLVYGLTLRDDNQPIDGVGVGPDISITGKNWQAKLPQYFRSPSLISAIEQTAEQPPWQ